MGGGESTFSKDMDESWARSSECGGNRGETLARVGEAGTKEGLRLEAMLCVVPNPEGRRSFISVRHVNGALLVGRCSTKRHSWWPWKQWRGVPAGA